MDSLTRCGLAAFALVCPIVSGVSGAADPGVIVTATRFPERELEVPVGVTVIHADAIAAHTARTLPELLAQVAGITTRDASGSPDRQIDMRGFGATGDQNTLVLVDGQRLNDIELNTVRWSSISLDSIERIEIMRGSGAVLYGGGASGALRSAKENWPRNSGIVTACALRCSGTTHSESSTPIPTRGPRCGPSRPG